jgi:hypothetical protein
VQLLLLLLIVVIPSAFNDHGQEEKPFVIVSAVTVLEVGQH